MHCGRDFDSPVDAGTGSTILDAGGGSQTTSDLEAALNAGDLDGIQNALTQSDSGPRLVGFALGAVALFTLPIVSPPGVPLSYILVVAGVAGIGATQSTVDAALRTGGKALALAPFLLVFIDVFLSYLFSGLVTTSATTLVGPAIYAGLVMYGIRWYRRR
ncbi:hypothetical protein [Haloarcula japonica]|uniref:Uncharacterized protein n=1 Tax=Haloarcula japonica (strain ATCC 49778 / DSM 6131 / JCM 7785 / NBRC 101032 / NCIMB 13157 / TR-1) TaxID=1227453 RepID=M0L7G0_HALJT|nr:hypothetical protein C444_16603 [Haloarcula japonica DSM 6131]